jgi:Tfp pilus assembly protein PilN
MRAINLIPAEQRRGAGGVAGRTGGVVYVIVAALVVIVALGVVYVSAVHQTATRKTTLAQVTAQAGAVSSQAAALQPYVAFASASQQRVQGVAALAEQRFDWPDAMAQLALSLPSGVHLLSLSGATGGSATGTSGPTQGSSGSTVAVNAASFSLSGCAPSQDVVAQTLSRLRQLRGVTGASVSVYQQGSGCTAVNFDMTLTYNASYAIPTGQLKAGAHSTVGG